MLHTQYHGVEKVASALNIQWWIMGVNVMF
jgi:hypothetical protein